MRQVAFAVLGIQASLSLFAQVALNFSSVTPSGGTGWQPISNTTSGKVFIDTGASGESGNLIAFYTLSSNGNNAGALQTSYDNLSGNLVGGATGTWTTNPMLQIQTGYIGGTTQNDLGVAFQLRLGSGDLTSVQRKGGLTVLIGVSPTNGSANDYSTFVIGASIGVSLVNSVSTITSSSVFLLDSGNATGTNKTSEYNIASGKFVNSTLLAGSSTTLASSSYVGYSSLNSNIFNAGTGTVSSSTYTDASDALFSFGVKFSSINDPTNGISLLARGSTLFDATTSKWEFAPATAFGQFSGTGIQNNSSSATNYTIYDGTGSSGNLQATDAFFTNGSSVSGSVPTVPEAPTFVWLAGLLLPIHWIIRLRRRRTTAAQQLTTA